MVKEAWNRLDGVAVLSANGNVCIYDALWIMMLYTFGFCHEKNVPTSHAFNRILCIPLCPCKQC